MPPKTNFLGTHNEGIEDIHVVDLEYIADFGQIRAARDGTIQGTAGPSVILDPLTRVRICMAVYDGGKADVKN